MNSTVALKAQAEEVAQHEKVIRGQKNDLKMELRTIELSHQEHVQKLTNENCTFDLMFRKNSPPVGLFFDIVF